MNKPREWVLTSEDLIMKVEGPAYSASERIRVIEWSAYLDLLEKLDEKDYAFEKLQKERDDYRATLESLAHQNGNEFAMQSEAQEALDKYPKRGE